MIKLKTAGAQWVNVGFQKDKGTQVLDIVNNSGQIVGYMIQTYEPKSHEFIPRSGIIMPFKTANIACTELKKGVAEPTFHLVALEWPKAVPQFEFAIWKKLEDKREDMQMVVCGMPPTFTGMENTSKTKTQRGSKPSKGSIEPDKLSDLAKSSEDKSMPKLMSAQPDKVSFQLPTGKAQLVSGTFKNIASTSIAFKIQTNKRLVYSVRPNKGVMNTNEEIKLQYEMNDTMTKQLAEGDKEKHLMQVTVVPWLNKSNEFNPDEWKKLEQNKKDLQKITLDIDFLGNGTPIIRADKSKKLINNQFVEVPLPHKVSFQAPFKGESKAVSMKNVTSELVAFKIGTNKRDYYAVSPCKGVIKPGESEEIKYEIPDKADVDALLADKDKHQFQIQVLKWSKDTFDPDEWKKLVADSKQETQKIMIDAEHQKDSISAKKPIPAPAKKSAPVSPVVAVHPLNVSYSIPTTDAEQSKLITVINLSPKLTAYKFKADESLMKCFTIKSNQGVIKPGKGEQIALVLKKGIDKMPDEQAQYTITINAINYPKEDFSDDLWKELETSKGTDFQTVELKVDIDEEDKMLSPDSTSQSLASQPPKKLSERQEESPVAPAVDPPQDAPAAGFKTLGPRLIMITPTRVTYKGPYGKKQTNIVKLVNVSVDAVAFKVQTNKTKFYMCSPSKGLLSPGAAAEISLILNESFTDKDVNAAVHRFNVLGLAWPDKDKQFDADKWKAIVQKNKEAMQTVIFEAQH